MNRSRLTERFASPAYDGVVIVVSAFDHPDRGRVLCPASPLVAAWLATRGVPAVLRPLKTRLRHGGQGSRSEGQLFATTYQDLDHRATGIATLARGPLSEHAEQAVQAWAACLRTRRLLVPMAAAACAASSAALLPQTRSEGVLLPEPTAGSPAPCGSAIGARECIRAFRERGDTVLLLGAGADALVGGRRRTVSPEPIGVLAVPDRETAASVGVPDASAVSFVTRPCSPTEEVAAILTVLRTRFPLLRGQHPDQWCYRATDGRSAARAAALHSDLTLCAQLGRIEWLPKSAVAVTEWEDLLPEAVAPAATIALVGAPRGLGGPGIGVADLIEALSGLGPTSVVRQRVVSEVITDIFAGFDAPPPSARTAPPAENGGTS